MHTERKHIPMVIGIALLILSPAMIFLLPNFVANTLYFRSGSWFVFTSGGIYILYTISFLLLIIASFLLYGLSLSKRSIYIGLGLGLVACLGFFIASQNYTMLTDDGITYRPLLSFEEHSYKWNEVEDATFKSIHKDDGSSKFTFSFVDDTELELTVNRLFYKFMSPIESRLNHEGVEVEKILVPRKK